KAQLEKQKRILQDTIDSFGIDAVVAEYVSGPRITLFRVSPAEGVRVESISSIDNNIAMALEAETVRIEAPIPGEPFVGIEIPSKKAVAVTMYQMLTSREWANSKAAIPIALGQDIRGQAVILDLNAAPHLLIAGATGSGKSVCTNAIILSLIYHFSPDDLRLILVDPKIVEMSVYGSLPHLITPVVTESTKVVATLKWTIREMERRYQILAEKGARNIAGYNQIIVEQTGDERSPQRLPFIVVIIDELADIMMTARADVETSLARIAQLSRAVGIHTVVATQRPSVDVITGVIKANFPSRIAFQVSSQIDSRTILDGKGAESLTGKGDMLFAPPGVGHLQRLQGTFVADHECRKVVDVVSEGVEQVFDEAILRAAIDHEGGGGEDGDDADEELIAEAIDVIRRDRRASTSYLQRTMRIGYNRAARIMDLLEERVVVGP
ncbi:MAG: DNA translocase FtsK, partial [Verrucomicrobiota bacterium]